MTITLINAIKTTLAACIYISTANFSCAATRTFSFSFDWDEGPLTGQITSGQFSFEATLFHPFEYVQAPHLFSSFNVVIDGRRFDKTEAPGHYLRFYPDRSLRMMAVGNNCGPVTCYVDDASDWAIAWDGRDVGYALYSHAPNVFSYAETIVVREISAIPEPSVWSLAMIGALVVASQLHLRARRFR